MEAYANDSLQLDAEQHGTIMSYSKTVGTLMPTPHLLTDKLSYGIGHGHETAAQRYNATRIQAGFKPERLEKGSRVGLGNCGLQGKEFKRITQCESTHSPGVKLPSAVGMSSRYDDRIWCSINQIVKLMAPIAN